MNSNQVEAAARWLPDSSTGKIIAAVEVANSALNGGMPPVRAVAQACKTLFPDVVHTRDGGGEQMLALNAAMETTMNALMAADRVERLGPDGILPIGDGIKVDPLAKLKAERKRGRGESREQVVSGLADRFSGAS